MKLLGKVMGLSPLSVREAEYVMGEIMDGKLTPAQIAGLIVALRMKGETSDEIVGFALAMRRRGVKVKARSRIVADTCGTGGDGRGTLNISTAAALVASAAGVVIAKHGNRSVSSRSGSADVLEALGVKIDPPTAIVEKCLDEAGFGFFFAPMYHPAMKYAGPPRRELGVPTIFNMLGPLTNPAGAQIQLLGVGSKKQLELIGGALAKLGTRHSLVVHSEDGLDELTPTGPTMAMEIRGHTIKRLKPLRASDLGIKSCRISDLVGGDAEYNAARLRDLLKGKRGAYRSAVVYNAGVVCWLAGKARTMRQGVALAESMIDSGAATERLEMVIKITQEGQKGGAT